VVLAANGKISATAVAVLRGLSGEKQVKELFPFQSEEFLVTALSTEYK
jgi:hypothetical protein